jgi:hypothetical protein
VIQIDISKYTNKQGENMQAIPKSSFVRSSHRVTLRAKYLPNSGRITVARYEGNTYGKDPQRITVTRNYALDMPEQYEQAILEYLRRANWGGHWVVSTITDGAVGVCAGEYLG